MGRPRGIVQSKPLQIAKSLPESAALSSPGVLILGIAREPLYVTPSAHRLLLQLDGLTDAPWGNTALPLAVQQICTELQQDKKRDPAGTDWDRMQARHLVHTAQGVILVRGYGIVDRHSAQTGRFLILLETVPAESALSDTDDATDFQVTARQRAILEGLDRGLTNKEIAGNLQLSVHTVKEYIRQLMTKLHTRTRTGVVAQVARLTPPAPNSSPKPAGSRKSQAPPSTVQRG
jgi:DNA-binding CsgD family transcriptional regulator